MNLTIGILMGGVRFETTKVFLILVKGSLKINLKI